jgi:hypothetical protein
MRTLLYLFPMLFLIGCKQNSNPNSVNLVANDVKDTSSFIPDTSKYALLKIDTAQGWIFPAQSRPTNLTKSDFREVEMQLKLCIKEYNNNFQRENEFNINFNRNKYQLIVIVNNKGEKEVWVNAFCENMEYWKKTIVSVCDGGGCYFNLKINLTKKIYYDLSVNGVA